MKKISIKNLIQLMGGITSPSNECAAMQNDLNSNGSTWTDEQFNKWLNKYISIGCTHAVITPDMNRPN